MTIFDWLTTATGQEFTHAVIVLLIATAGYLTYLAKRAADKNAAAVRHHLAEHSRTRASQRDTEKAP